jgi:hypothetical protein
MLPGLGKVYQDFGHGLVSQNCIGSSSTLSFGDYVL